MKKLILIPQLIYPTKSDIFIKRNTLIYISILLVLLSIPDKMAAAYIPPYSPSSDYARKLTIYPATPAHFPLEPTDSVPFRYCLVSMSSEDSATLGGLRTSSVSATERGSDGILDFNQYFSHEVTRSEMFNNLCPFNLVENSAGSFNIMFNRGPGYEGQYTNRDFHHSIALDELRPSYLAKIDESGQMFVSIFKEDAIAVTIEWDEENEALIKYGDRILRYIYCHNNCRLLFLNPAEYPLGSRHPNYTNAVIEKIRLCMIKKTIPFNPCFRKTFAMLGPSDGLINKSTSSDTFSVIATDNSPISIFVKPDENHSLFIPFRVEGPESSDLAFYVDPYIEDSPQIYKEVRLMPRANTSGRFKFSLIIDEDCDYSPEIALIGQNRDFYFTFLSKERAHWRYGNQEEYVPNLNITYNTSPDPDNIFRLYVREAGHTEFEEMTDATDLVNQNISDDAEIGIERSFNGGYHLAHSPIWDFSDGKSEITHTFKGGPIGSSSLYLLGNVPDLTITVKPHKPTLNLDFNAIPHSDSYDEEYIISIPRGCFAEGNEWSNSQYARLMLIPQFKTFEHTDSATAHYGVEPREDIKDSWLSNTWYKQNKHDGFLPVMKWDSSSQCYDCHINPTNMTYVSWDGKESKGHHLVSGRYKAVLIPSLDPDARQYGIAPSDSVDFYIYPSFDEIKLGLCIRETEDSEPHWEYYTMEYSWTNLITGPNGTTEHGQVAYGHSKLLPISDYTEIWYNTDPYNQSFYSPSQTLKATETEVTNAKIPKGYTKLESDDYMDLSNKSEFNVILAKNGAVTPDPMLIYVDKDENNEIITGIESVSAGSNEQAEAEYFTPAGVRVEKPSAPGIYIERREGKTRKIVIR